ncbi:DUF2069 domain-containing protein [Aestuariibacter sp. AA17]|uniref:DUF2069 domain-containing protein n=1 Tax=Fluctibacter corallii TaxID=2984329 RepID=A0ABT3A637_9ALTE|nr:DUF2069 domain-containing protein [Aestuariibacter sp. AA17]MCV2884042.1 DUF2069 domain-containing protein [Aestuariibacter sp. AA17]
MTDTTKIKRYRILALTGYFGLLIFVALWQWVLVESPQTSLLFRSLWIIPLLLPLKGMITGNPYTHAWANFIVLIYFLHGLTAIYAVQEEWFYALLELLFASMMFIGCVYYARLKGKETGLGLKKLKDVMAEEKQRFEGKE